MATREESSNTVRSIDENGRKIDRRSKGGKKKLIDAARKLFGEKGFHGATVRDIAAEAGMSYGLIRNQFGSKEGLRRAVDERTVGWLRSLMEDTSALDEEDPLKAIQTALLEQWDADFFAERFNYLRRAIFEMTDASVDLFDGFVELYTGFVQKIRESGKLRDDIDDEWLVYLFLVNEIGSVLLAPYLERSLDLSFTSRETWRKKWERFDELLERGVYKND